MRLAGWTVFKDSDETVGCKGLALGMPKSVPQVLKPGYWVSPLASG